MMEALLEAVRILDMHCNEADTNYQAFAVSLVNIVRPRDFSQSSSSAGHVVYSRICIDDLLEFSECLKNITCTFDTFLRLGKVVFVTPKSDIRVFIKTILAVHCFGHILFHYYYQLKNRRSRDTTLEIITRLQRLGTLKEIIDTIIKYSRFLITYLFNRYPEMCQTPPSSRYDYFHRFHYDHWLDVERGLACQQPTVHRPPYFDKLWNKIPIIQLEEELFPDGVRFSCFCCKRGRNTRTNNCMIIADCECTICVICFEDLVDGYKKCTDDHQFQCKGCKTEVTAWTTYYHCQIYTEKDYQEPSSEGVSLDSLSDSSLTTEHSEPSEANELRELGEMREPSEASDFTDMTD